MKVVNQPLHAVFILGRDEREELKALAEMEMTGKDDKNIAGL